MGSDGFGLIMLPGGRPWRALAGLAAAIGLLGGCMVKKPQVPSTDFTISLPVADETITAEELATDTNRNESAYLTVSDDGLVNLDFAVEFVHREEVGDRLRLRPTENTFHTPIGSLALPGRELPEVEVSLEALFHRDVGVGVVPLLPATSVDHLVAVPLGVIEEMDVEEGGIEISLGNHLPVPLLDLRLSIVDRGHGDAVVATMDLGTVAPEGRATGTADLAGRALSGNLLVRVSGGTPQASDVEVTASSGITLGVVLLPLRVSSATAVIPAQEFGDHQVLLFPDARILVERATIGHGGLTLRVRNDIPVLVELELSLDELRQADGSVHTFRVDSFEPYHVREVHFDLSGNEFAPVDPHQLRFSYRGRTVGSDSPVTIGADGEVQVEALTEDLVLSHVEGVLDGVELPVPPAHKKLDIPRGLENVHLHSARALVYLRSALGFRSHIMLDLHGTNRRGQEADLRLVGDFERASYAQPQAAVVELPADELTGFLNLLPTRVDVAPTIRVGDGVGHEVIDPSHWIEIDSVRFIAPGRLAISAPTEIRPLPDFRELRDPEARERIEANLLRAEVRTDIENHTPFGVGVSVLVTSWRRIVRDVIGAYHPELNTDEALLDWLVAQRAWELLSAASCAEIRSRMEESMGLRAGALGTVDDRGILERIEAGGAAASRVLLLNEILGSLQNETKDGGVCQVENLLGVQITKDEWDDWLMASVYGDPELRIPPEGGPFVVAPAPTDADGRVTQSAVSGRSVALTDEQILVFVRTGGVYTGVRTEVEATPGEVLVLAEHYVRVRAAAKVDVELNESLLKD